jgi:hypothetical protein
MKITRIVSFITAVFILVSFSVGCGSRETGNGIGGAVEQAAQGAQSALNSASETAKNTVGQVGEGLQAAGTVVVEQGGEVAEVVSSAGETTAEVLKERIASLQPDDDGNFTIAIQQDEINKIIKIQELFAGPVPGNPLRNKSVAFQQGFIIFTAEALEPLGGQLLVRFSANVEDDRVRFEVIDASLGENETPQSVLDAAAETLDSTLGEALRHLPPTLKIREIVISDGSFILNGGGPGTED